MTASHRAEHSDHAGQAERAGHRVHRVRTHPAGTTGSARRPALRLALGAALVLTLTGCQTGTEPAQTPSAPPTVTQEPDPTPTPEPTEPSDPGPTPTAEPTPTPGEGATNGPNSLTSPTLGETVDGPDVVVRGEGTAFEATLDWRVLRAGTEDVVAEGYTQAGANGDVGPFEIPLELEPGEYTVEVWEPDVSDGASGQGQFINLVEVTFTVG